MLTFDMKEAFKNMIEQVESIEFNKGGQHHICATIVASAEINISRIADEGSVGEIGKKIFF